MICMESQITIRNNRNQHSLTENYWLTYCFHCCICDVSIHHHHPPPQTPPHISSTRKRRSSYLLTTIFALNRVEFSSYFNGRVMEESSVSYGTQKVKIGKIRNLAGSIKQLEEKKIQSISHIQSLSAFSLLRPTLTHN